MYLWDVKKYIGIIVTALAALLCCSSCNPYRKLEVRDIALKEVNLFANPATIAVDMTVYNPSRELEITEIQGSVKHGEKKLVHFVTDTLVIPKRCESHLQARVQVFLADGVGVFQLLRVLQAQDLSTLSADASATVKDCLGIRRRKEIVNFKLSELEK